MKRFGVIGYPVAHSLSPLLHRTAYSLLGLDCTYEAFSIAPSSLGDALRDFKSRGFSGLNVTIPHKESMLSMVDSLSDEAKAVGAVNTVLFQGGRLRGDNTDVDGFAASIAGFRSDIEGRTALLLGAGGSARAITYALLTRFAPAEVIIANRNEARARDLATHFRPYSKQTAIRDVAASDESVSHSIERSALIVNATPVGMSPTIDASPVSDRTSFRRDQIVVDLIYTPLETRLLKLAMRFGARTISGLEMFLHQGARSFDLWLDRTMPVDRLRPIILQELKNLSKNNEITT